MICNEKGNIGMEEVDYKKIGFKCGIEIHQQIEGKKLFCNCKTIIRKDKPDIIVKRTLRASAGETGEIDKAAIHEQKKGKYFLYQAYSDTTCLVELDDEPPGLLNKEALDVALQISLILNAKIVDEIQFMRKTVVDGSNTSGFQRTALIAKNGYINTSLGKVSIPIICLEEEAAQSIKRTDEYDVYNISRLGIPLIEIGTDPDIKTPEHAKEVAEKLGMILRSTGKVKRGIGTIRQDVNLSIKGGARIEIKGFQDLKSIPKVIQKEVSRQLFLLKKHKKIKEEVRKAEPDFTTSFLRPMPGAARMYPETDVLPIKPDIKNIKIPKLISEHVIDIAKKHNLTQDMARLLIKNNVDLDYYVKKYPNIKPLLIAETFVNTPKELKKRYNVEIDIKKYADEVFEKLDRNIVSKEAVVEVLVELSKNKKIDYSKYKDVSLTEIEKQIKKIIEGKKGLSFGAYMGLLMAKFRGKVDGKKIAEMLKKNL